MNQSIFSFHALTGVSGNLPMRNQRIHRLSLLTTELLGQLIPAAICMRLERPGTWLHGGSVGRDVGFLGMPQLPPEHGDVAGGTSSQIGKGMPPHRMHF